MQDGFLFDELSEFKKDIMRNIKEVFPEETKKFIKKEAQKLTKVAKKIAKREVGTSKGEKENWQASKSYHNKFKAGKVYKYAENDACCRAYNSAPHAHLIEYGHVNVPRSSARATTREGRKEQASQSRGTGFTMGKLIFKQAEMQFLSEYLNDAEEFMYKYFDETSKGKGH